MSNQSHVSTYTSFEEVFFEKSHHASTSDAEAHLAARPVATMVAPADPAAAGGPGSGDAKTRAESERSADALFESRSLDEIREVRARAARDAEAKDEELRQRVGSSYRDAIATADCVLEMETTAARATETLDEAVRVLTALPNAVASIEKGAPDSADARAPPPSSREYGVVRGDDDALYGAGTRVKFLVDTPEKIWGSLEARDRVGAARRFLAARDVLSGLGAKNDGAGAAPELGGDARRRIDVARAFPIVEQQAPLLESFRAQISRAARAGLADARVSGNRLDGTRANLAFEAADALAALVAVEDLSAERALRVFLQTRRAWVRAALEGARNRERAEGNARDASDARETARALAAACREARRVPGVLVACFGGADALEGDARRGDADLDDSASSATREDDFATLASWGGGPSTSSRAGALPERREEGTRFAGDDEAPRETKTTALRPLLLAAVEALDGPRDGASPRAAAAAAATEDAADADDAEADAEADAEKNASSSAETFRGVADPREETARRAARAARRAQTLGALPMRRDALAAAYREWLADVAEDVAAGGVFGGVASLGVLADVERRVEAAEAKSARGEHAPTRADASSLGGADVDARGVFAGRDAGPAGRAARLGAACERARLALLGASAVGGVLASPASPWASLAEAPHAARARELLARAFQFASLRAATEARLAATRAPPRRASPLAPSPEGRALWTEGWSRDDDAAERDADARDARRETRASREAREARSAPAPPTRRAAERLAKALAESLRNTRRDVVAFASGSPGSSAFGSAGSGALGALGARGARGAARLARLESFAHAECAKGVRAYAAFLDAKLDAFEADAASAASAASAAASAAAERVFLVGLAARLASDDAEELASFLGPSSSWAEETDETEAGALAGAGAARARARRRRAAARSGTVPGGALASSLAALRAVAARGFRRWADRAARAMRLDLERALFDDDALVSEERREDWEEDAAAAAAGVTARLPALASPYAFGAAHAVCAEALRCGGHALPPAAARALSAAAAREALGAYQARLAEASPRARRVSEKGALQALFDARFLYEAFGDHLEHLEDADADAAADAARTNAAALRGVVTTASAALDPIDWATYEAPLWRAVARARARSATALGLASASGGSGTSSRESSRAPTSATSATSVAAPSAGPGPGPGSAESAPPPPRFAYLPVGAPAARFRTRSTVGGFARGARGSLAAGAAFPLDADGRAGGSSRASLVDWSAAGFDAFGETERPDAPRDGTAGVDFFGKLAGRGLGFIRAL